MSPTSSPALLLACPLTYPTQFNLSILPNPPSISLIHSYHLPAHSPILLTCSTCLSCLTLPPYHSFTYITLLSTNYSVPFSQPIHLSQPIHKSLIHPYHPPVYSSPILLSQPIHVTQTTPLIIHSPINITHLPTHSPIHSLAQPVYLAQPFHHTSHLVTCPLTQRTHHITYSLTFYSHSTCLLNLSILPIFLTGDITHSPTHITHLSTHSPIPLAQHILPNPSTTSLIHSSTHHSPIALS